MRKILFLLIVMLPMLAACSSVSLRLNEQAEYLPPYAGTQRALAVTKKSWSDYNFIGEPALYALDIPLCLIADTLLLPYDYYQSR